MPGLCTKDEHDRFGSLLEISKMSIWDKENVNRYSYVTELNIVLLSFFDFGNRINCQLKIC